MALLTLKDIHKHFAEKHLLRGVSLTVNEGDRIGLVGPNGAGKTTLLRILAGHEPFEEGERTTQKALRTAYLEQEPTLPANLTIREVVSAGAENPAPHRVESLIDRTGLRDPDALCGTLSGGEARRVALAS
ncbi:MAG: ATP-binding cassette domain-containing protein, partial [Planctomycetota bacterium]